MPVETFWFLSGRE